MKWILLLFLGITAHSFAQSDSFLVSCRARDTIWFAGRLKPAFDKMYRSKINPTSGVTTIVQIGDSHVQMGWFSGAIREQLNVLYGNVGSNQFWFPYSVVNGYNPSGVRFSYSGPWTGEKMVNSPKETGFGITGHALVLTEKGPEQPSFDVDLDVPLKTLELVVVTNSSWKFCVDSAVVKTKKISGNLSLVTITQTKASMSLKVKMCPQGKLTPLRILGFRNATIRKTSGIDFQYYGSSGGKYSDYINRSHYFFESLAYLKPDLLIISLGTNDSYVHGLTDADYYALVIKFIRDLKNQHPKMSILLTMPPDTAFRQTKPESARVVFETLFKIAQQNNCALWNFAEIMGGSDSIHAWSTAGLANSDLMHLNEKGYAVQGALLVEALNKAYAKYYK